MSDCIAQPDKSPTFFSAFIGNKNLAGGELAVDMQDINGSSSSVQKHGVVNGIHKERKIMIEQNVQKVVVAGKSMAVAMFLASFLVGCAAPPTAPDKPLTTKISCNLPTLTPMKETKEYQEKGGIRVALMAASYQCELHKEEKLVPTQPTMQESLLEGLSKPSGAPRSQYFEKSVVPVFKVTPERLRFTFKLNNKLARVFRGAGTVIQFNIAGKTQRIDQNDYRELIGMIVPPRNEQQVDFYGPGIEQIPDQSTIGIFLYDVVTKTDAAGNTLEKQNFEWYFKYAKELREEEREITKERVRMDPRR